MLFCEGRLAVIVSCPDCGYTEVASLKKVLHEVLYAFVEGQSFQIVCGHCNSTLEVTPEN